ncbi:MAG: hypothetical protein KJO40_00365 [Deltaproteobacteria bacterium]|nr:hypothetical protein [Deltaproteobacteria bacterium]NND28591.1 hypothetical protein [Myxococcales bacterium]MBT8464620.1 hypothetical protein [Deltaproteobacteria bacterium]MBT8481371.1 hypothetical protein [Deltaproteobacteria bacterium]NNK06989.1 hypothetical protein [Myxococcales bacterium]
MNKMRVRSLILMSVLLVSWSCKKDGSSTTAANAPVDPVLLLDAGAEPQSRLRYKINEGTTTKSNMDFGMATLAKTSESAALSVVPGVRLHIVSGPAMATDRGAKFEVKITRAEAAIPQGLDPKVAKELQQSAAILDDVGGTVEMNDRGVTLATELNDRAKSPDIPVRLLMMIVNARTTLSRVVLPAEAVGLGARWEARKELQLYGFKVQQVDTYTLVERVGDEIKLKVAVTQNALPQTVDFPDEGIAISVEQMSANANGEIILNLNALESDAAASGAAVDKLSVSTPEGTEKIEVDEAFEIRMTNTTAFE